MQIIRTRSSGTTARRSKFAPQRRSDITQRAACCRGDRRHGKDFCGLREQRVVVSLTSVEKSKAELGQHHVKDIRLLRGVLSKAT